MAEGKGEAFSKKQSLQGTTVSRHWRKQSPNQSFEEGGMGNMEML